MNFVIVGTPRSGTTLVQRLASEVRGVRVPRESLFLDEVVYGALTPRQFPLRGEALRQAIAHHQQLHERDGRTLDGEAVIGRLSGEARTVVDLYEAIIDELAGDAALIGDKTPGHLLWWRLLTRSRPGLKLVIVVREPRAVVASNLVTTFGMRHAELHAQRWACDQDLTVDAAATLGPARCLVVRYEHVVDAPDAARDELARFLGSSALPEGERSDPGSLIAAHETWKARAGEEITADRNAAGADALTPRQRAEVDAICRRHLARFGYGAAPSRHGAWTTASRLPPRAQVRRAAFVLGRARTMAFIHRFAVPTPDRRVRRPG